MFDPQTLSELLDSGFHDIVDVRSPAEFAEDHLPGAINLPVLSNEERAEVGTIYVQESRFKARKLGAAMVFRNSARHLETVLADHDGSWRPLVYCWRGGQRSGAFAWMLREVGWRAETHSGGYRRFRQLVVQALYEQDLSQKVIRIGGYTGTAKTEILGRLADLGLQVIDLEGLARHRGSLLGERTTPQPSQKFFETTLAVALARLDPARPLVIEAESSKIGKLNLPPALWGAMKHAPMIEVKVPLAARAEYLADAYRDVLADADALKSKLLPLRRYRGRALLAQWNALIDARDHVALCRSLAEDHYDRAYDKSFRATAPQILEHAETDRLTPDAIDRLAERIAERIQTSSV